MMIPPFPSQDLAKLVLGYLAEEQLMTAYDEFLQASPYLDAFRNEYDRIFMTSLRSIVAEYRAVKIFVETCKPYALRRRIIQCSNMLEVVKFLIQHVDMNKILTQEASVDRTSSDSRHTSYEAKVTQSCDVCASLKLVNCLCKPSAPSSNHTTCRTESMSLEVSNENQFSEETGKHTTTRKRHVKVLEKDSKISQSNCDQNAEMTTKQYYAMSAALLDHNSPNNDDSCSQIKSSQVSCPATHHNLMPKLGGATESTQKLAEFNEVLNSVKSKPPTEGRYHANAEDAERVRVSTAGTFQDFATGVGGEVGTSTVPDSSTSENYNAVSQITKEISTTCASIDNQFNSNGRGLTKAHILLKVGRIPNETAQTSNEAINLSKDSTPRHRGILKPKTMERVTILSDIKVDKTLKMPPVLKNATSTPLMQMQTIMINGTPAFKHDPNQITIQGIQSTGYNYTAKSFTKDEIMAMPTIIIVPASGPSQVPGSLKAPTITTQSTSTVTSLHASQSLSLATIDPPETPNLPTSSNTVRSLEPLILDVPTNSCICTEPDKSKDTTDNVIVKPVEIRNATVPKDNTDGSKASTPHMLPPARKSSSTPRRTSHVRVLDFTTPRRILEETINEHVLEGNCGSPVEVVVSRSPSLHTFIEKEAAESNENTAKDNNRNGAIENNASTKLAGNKKSNWDADLRALAIGNEKDPCSKPTPRPKPRPKKIKAGKKPCDCDVTEEKTPIAKKKASKSKLIKNVEETAEVEDPIIVVDDSMSAPVKPTINIINGPEWNHDDDKPENKSSSEDHVDTPEMERLSLQNVIGAKLNISDLLETPYKQALYDIQMETPRFLGPDIPGEPLSDIKIMNIPTPRFLNNTPKPVQATPSSYSSRPTDYSSGGSYYKPDDLDYLPAGDLGYPDSSKEHIPSMELETKETDKVKDVKSRPVRQCRKNVSYYNVLKGKEADDKTEVGSLCSETISVNSSSENKIESKPAKERKSKASTKSEPKKRSSIAKKRKTPVKKESPKTFVKIKPRRPTPTKDINGRKRKTSQSQRKRTSSKDKSINITPVVSAPTKSRRKSSTPRKIHCTKQFTSESSGHDSPDMTKNKPTVAQASRSSVIDSDTEQLALRWSDDGSQVAKLKDTPKNPPTESDDISQIKEYLATSEPVKRPSESNYHVDLVKRGFDEETARIIERDLLDTPPHNKDSSSTSMVVNDKKESPVDNLASDNSKENSDQEKEEEIELSVHECNEDSDNYIVCEHDDTKQATNTTQTFLKDNFCMEICIEDDLQVRLRVTPFTVLLDQDPSDQTIERFDYSYKDSEVVSNVENLNTPMKEAIKAQCCEIFDSTLTSLDSPLKMQSPSDSDVSVTEIVLEVENLDSKDKENKKRKRGQSGNSSDESTNECKKTKPEYFCPANIQNIDIETVLSKLHGP